MENDNFQILSNDQIKDLNIINNYMIKEEEKKKELSENISVKGNNSNKMETSYVIIKEIEEDKNDLEEGKLNDDLNKGFKFMEEIVKREKLFLSASNKRDKQFKRLNFKEILNNINKLNREAKKKFKLKLHKRKSVKQEK